MNVFMELGFLFPGGKSLMILQMKNETYKEEENVLYLNFNNELVDKNV